MTKSERSAERTNRYRAFSRGLTVAAMLLAACSSGGSGPGSGAGGSTGAGATVGLGAGGSGGSGGASCHTPGTLQVTASGTTAYVIDGNPNPDLTFCRGSTYVFALDAAGHPFYIKTVQGAGAGDAYNSGVATNGMDVGNVTFAVPSDAPATLFYDCSLHPPMTGTIHIVN